MASNYEQIIQPSRGWLNLDVRALVQYRDLLVLMVRRDFVSRFKQTILGPAWFVLQPLLNTIVFTIVFGNFAKLPTDKVPPMLFYLCGQLPWQYFAQTLPQISLSLINNSQLFSKVYFPRLIVPLSSVISGLFAFCLQLITFLCFFCYYKFFTPHGDKLQITWAALSLPLLIIQVGLISLGFGLWLASITAKYRDFTHLMQFIVQLWMYATPVIYPLSLFEGKWRIPLMLNPMTSVLEYFRIAFFGAGSADMTYITVSVGITLLVLISGLAVFGKVERTFVDII